MTPVERVRENLQVAHEDTAAGVGRVEPLVRIERDGVGATDPGEQRRQVVGERRRAAVGASTCIHRSSSRGGPVDAPCRRSRRSRPCRVGDGTMRFTRRGGRSRSSSAGHRSACGDRRPPAHAARSATPTPSMSAARSETTCVFARAVRGRRRTHRYTFGPDVPSCARIAGDAQRGSVREGPALRSGHHPTPSGVPNVPSANHRGGAHLDLDCGRREPPAARVHVDAGGQRLRRCPGAVPAPETSAWTRGCPRNAECSKVMRRRYSGRSASEVGSIGHVHDTPAAHALEELVGDHRRIGQPRRAATS